MADQTAQAEQNVGALTNQARQAAAYNAFSAAHGPVAAYGLINPEAAQESQNYLLRGQTDPIAVQQAAATLAGTQAEVPLKQAQTAQSQANTTNLNNMNAQTAGIRGARMLQAIANPDGSIPQDEAAHVLSNPAYGLSPDEQSAYLARMSEKKQVDPKTGQVISKGGTGVLDDIVSALQAGGKVSGGTTAVLNPDGTTTLYRSTAGGGLIGNTVQGTTAPIIQAQTNQTNAPIRARAAMISATQPKGIVVSPTGEVQTVGGGRVAGTGIQSIQGPAGTQAKAEASTVGKAQGVNAANALPQNVAIARTSLGQADLQFGRASSAIDKAADLAGPLTTGLAGRVSEAIGTPQRKALDAQIAGIKSNVSMAVAQLSRVDKNAPFAIRNLQEFKSLQDNLGPIDPNAGNAAVHQQLNTIRQNLGDLQNVIHSKYSATYGAGVLAPERGKQGNGALPGGFVYLGKVSGQ